MRRADRLFQIIQILRRSTQPGAPATTSVITQSTSRSDHRGGVCVCIDEKG
jgi:hypothetical protein